MSKKGLSRRDFMKVTGGLGAGALIGAKSFGVPAFVRQVGTPDLTDPAAVGAALTKEGAQVKIHSWGFGGLSDSIIPNAFTAYTQKKYGVPVTLTWSTNGDLDNGMTTLPIAGKIISDEGYDVIDKEEDSYAQILALDWTEPINLPQYAGLLDQLPNVEAPYVFHEPTMVQDGADIYAMVYQGYEWLQGLLRKDKVDTSKYKDWTDLANPELKGKGIDYAFNDGRGHYVFMGILNSLIKQKIVTGDLWSQDAWTQGITWWGKNLEQQILVYGDIGNDPTMQLKLHTGDAWWGATWGSYVRELLGTDWNQAGDLLFPFYPSSGIAADRQALRAAKGAPHPIAARVLINWFATDEFQNVGWTKDTPDATDATNHWNVTQSNYLTAYAGGIQPSNRTAGPTWSKPYYPADPGSLILPVNWTWYIPQKQWISDTYDHIVKGI